MLNLNKLIMSSPKPLRGTERINLTSWFPVPYSVFVFENKKEKRRLSVACRVSDIKLLKILAKAVFVAYKKRFGVFPKVIIFLTPSGKIKIREQNIDTTNLNALLLYSAQSI